ncbi:uncharacterized protein LAESUDRAFT_194116 [Laetiporus sulphureus 93-53]|uniref:F-box domain-containing protein n=1 Tax=Laetiporus sulphureus 93-53 TaxID=1314785 RepID=A0A165E0Q2_9APHY|nr:uncharacterized protein LAESUDRAFT_194116 [Laetiporus sulphureus 93-53]KZT06021.1 hypothetical protein LAESUDRAFT_194116 [Laetiporus sulphureus 93-53]
MSIPVDQTNVAPPILNNPQPRLPAEICERIIDHLDPFWLGDQRQTLLNCALVRRGWYAESRAILFEEPILSTRKEAIACARSLTRIPLLAARVRRLEIGARSPTLESSMTSPELASILVMLAGKLPNLASLSFSDVSFEQCSMRNLAFGSLHEFSHITSLRLARVTLPSASPFFQVICSFPQLQSLHCWDLHWSKLRSMAPLPEHRRMPLTTLTSFEYDLSCFEDIGHILLGLLNRAILTALYLYSPVSTAALNFTQDMLNIAGGRLEEATTTFSALEKDGGGSFQSLLLHPISFESNVNLRTLVVGAFTSDMNDLTLLVRSVLLPLLKTILSKDLSNISFSFSPLEWDTDAMLNIFDPEVCVQIDELLAEEHFAELGLVSIFFCFQPALLDDSQCVKFCADICSRFPKLNDMNILTINCNRYRYPSDTERALKSKQMANRLSDPADQSTR